MLAPPAVLDVTDLHTTELHRTELHRTGLHGADEPCDVRSEP